MDRNLENLISQTKREYTPLGFHIVGVFGSLARGEAQPDSDIDLLYELSDDFKARYNGLDFYAQLEDIKADISKRFNMPVHLANREALDDVGEYFILPEVIYVA